jgi:hypothetical protein
VTTFQQLGAGDVLFIDSSHIAKINSDVNYLLLDVLPSLQKDVLIQIHDIPFPYPTPEPELWIFKRHLFWTEAALLHALLIGSQLFQVLLCSSYLHYKAPEALRSAFQNYDPARHFPTSIWLLKLR